MSDNYANAAHIPGGSRYFATWREKAGAFRIAHPPETAAGMDLFRHPAPKGVMVFVHGGFWMETGPHDWSHLAAGALAQGWSVAMPGYTLAPAGRIGGMVEEVCAAVQALAGPRIVVTGHSAGGHLAAMVATRIAVERIVPISPLADLRPFLDHPMNEVLRLDAAEAAAQSPVDHRPLCPVHVHVGGQERAAFLWQARLLSEVWDCPWTVAAGRHHFDVIEDLERPSPLLDVLLQG
ncbi:alpha/beta hydrolase [Cereibacter sp. SYSU M97828]|nr:alpha/beta hydrolase [Cereibacter flavus]